MGNDGRPRPAMVVSATSSSSRSVVLLSDLNRALLSRPSVAMLSGLSRALLHGPSVALLSDARTDPAPHATGLGCPDSPREAS